MSQAQLARDMQIEFQARVSPPTLVGIKPGVGVCWQLPSANTDHCTISSLTQSKPAAKPRKQPSRITNYGSRYKMYEPRGSAIPASYKPSAATAAREITTNTLGPDI